MQRAAKPGPTHYIIHAAGAEDAGLIRSLTERIWPKVYAHFLTPHQIANMIERIYSEENLHKERQEGHRFWLAYSGDEAVGYVSAYKEEDAVWLKKLYCDPDYQGQGIGSAMAKTAIQAFLPAKEVRLLVNKDNIAAQAYYERRGFKRIGEMPVVMGDFPFTDYLYAKSLTEK